MSDLADLLLALSVVWLYIDVEKLKRQINK